MRMPIRLISLILALLLALPGAAIAEVVGQDTTEAVVTENVAQEETTAEPEPQNMFRKYSTVELFALKVMLDTEIASRDDATEFSVTVPRGKYIVGIDIPARAYTLTNPSDDDMARILVTDQNGKSVYYFYLHESEVYGKLDLLEGYTVELENPVTFTRYKGLGF